MKSISSLSQSISRTVMAIVMSRLFSALSGGWFLRCCLLALFLLM